MKTLFILLFTHLAALAVADDRLIPFDRFYISVPVDGARNTREMRVSVRIFRSTHQPEDVADIQLTLPGLRSSLPPLNSDEVSALMEACSAAKNNQDYHKEVRFDIHKTIWEAAVVDGQRQVRIRRGGEALISLDQVARLRESLAQAEAAQAWYEKLLTEHTLPKKTENAHPPHAASYFLIARLGAVSAEGLDYEVSLNHYGAPLNDAYQVNHGVRFFALGESMSTSSGAWVKSMLDHVALALNAVGKKQAYQFEAPPDGQKDSSGRFTVTANLTTQKADVTFEPGRHFGRHSPIEGAFDLAQLTAIRELVAQGEARQKWFAEHEAWFFEKQ